jgi:hypothetical protein
MQGTNARREIDSVYAPTQAGLVARIVAPMAPYCAALRRVSANAERAYVSTRGLGVVERLRPRAAGREDEVLLLLDETSVYVLRISERRTSMSTGASVARMAAATGRLDGCMLLVEPPHGCLSLTA